MARKVKGRERELEEKLARALADYDNLVKRFDRDKKEFEKRASELIVRDLLPVLDDLVRAQKHLVDEGLGMAIGHFTGVLEKFGVQEINTARGDEFDASIHEALETREGGKEGTIAEVLSPGYKWDDGRVLRPARVAVYGPRPEKEKELDQELGRGDYV